jgi:hypothetical protein
MKTYNCLCGAKEYWTSGYSPQSCEGCDKCKTNFRHQPTEPHQFEEYYLGGKVPSRVLRCSKCYHIER